ncbi:MAG TPA: acetyl-CoA carboxylase, biotin carboxyl carrier protein [Ruminococcaceae bacterium]|nr:acetyl-CoA carboxylase, biotin carboxyl carrier protein [Oscillospiraceae bacterium]
MSTKEKDFTPIEDSVECVEALAKIVRENKLSKIKISTEQIDITIEGENRPIGGILPPVPPMAIPQAAPAESVPAAKPEAVSGRIITSPIVGTFYSSPSPEKPAFVKVGDSVNAGDVVCIIESMKLMNEINSEFSGKVAEIYVDNGESVEFGQKLMRIE